MYIYPAIDLYEGKAVRLFKGDYSKMTIYSNDPVSVARDFASQGASHIHIVDLEGAKNGTAANISVIKKIIESSNLFAEAGGGIRSIETVKKYIDIGVQRVILGTSAVVDEEFLMSAVKMFGKKIAVGADIKDGVVAIRGWTEKSSYKWFDFCKKMSDVGIDTIICTDISKDGAMTGINKELYRKLSENFDINIIASGGVSSIDDIKSLAELNLHGAIIGKAYYTGAVSLKDAIEVAE